MPVMSNRACKLRLKWQSEQRAEQHADSRQAASLLVMHPFCQDLRYNKCSSTVLEITILLLHLMCTTVYKLRCNVYDVVEKCFRYYSAETGSCCLPYTHSGLLCSVVISAATTNNIMASTT